MTLTALPTKTDASIGQVKSDARAAPNLLNWVPAAEYERLKGNGVEFKGEPMDVGDSVIATLDDTCGNLIMIYEEK